MSAGTFYIISAVIFGVALSILEIWVKEWWILVPVAVIYFSLARYIALRIERLRKRRGDG